MTVTPTVTADNLYRHTARRDAQLTVGTVTPDVKTVTPVFPASADVLAIVRLALAEDIGRGDLTTEATISPDAVATAEILQKAPGVLCGLPVIEAVFRELDPRVRVTPLADEGSYFGGTGSDGSASTSNVGGSSEGNVNIGSGSASSRSGASSGSGASGGASSGSANSTVGSGSGGQGTRARDNGGASGGLGGGGASDRRIVARLEGPAAAILSGERTALNFMQRLSGVATASRRAAQLVAGTRARVIDTRKTTPGLRVLEKYAVRVGGATNHRAGLDDGFLIKENHIRAAGGITRAVQAAQKRAAPGQVVEVEVTNLDELEEALTAGATLVLLDNFSEPGLRMAVVQAAGRARLEASGGISLDNLAAVAATGVDYISLGALTHSAGVLDFSLEVRL